MTLSAYRHAFVVGDRIRQRGVQRLGTVENVENGVIWCRMDDGRRFPYVYAEIAKVTS